MMSTDRRTLLRLLAFSTAAALGGGRPTPAAPTPVMVALDHLLLGVSDLDYGIAWVEERTGIRPAVGGSHPGKGTRNALLALGERQYLEIIAPDPAQRTDPFQFDLRTLKEPRLVTWAAKTRAINELAGRVRASGRQVFGPADGSRTRPEGGTLTWRTLRVASDLPRGAIDPIPFFIEWAADARHPAEDAPKGCVLTNLRLEYPNPSAVLEMLKLLDIEIEVAVSAEASLHATLATAKGKLALR